jgi:twinkle protein
MQQVAEMLPVGKVYTMRLQRKDANEVLVNDGKAPITRAFWDAAEWRPDGIVDGKELWETILSTKEAESVGYPWPVVNIKTHGLRRGELVTVTAGSGIGKSAFVREISYNLLSIGETVGMIMLEESTTRTAMGIMGLHINRPLHLGREGVSTDDLRKAFTATVGSGRLYLYDHFGSTEIDNLLNRVRYMAKAIGCKWIILDHLSIVVSALEGNDERKLIDRAMTLLRTLVQETGIGLVLVSHLRRPDGKGDEEGAATSLNRLRGSHSIAQLSDLVIGLERNQQGDDPDKTIIRVLKNRYSGETGEAGCLHYDKLTGRMNESTI